MSRFLELVPGSRVSPPPIGISLMCKHVLAALFITLLAAEPASASDMTLTLRSQIPVVEGSSNYHSISQAVPVSGAETALIICDVWDSHNCANAVFRANELVPRLDQVIREARQRGVTIIHAPSGCMEFYKSHPGRIRSQAAPRAAKSPPKITEWCHQIPSEEQGLYPIDQSNGGCDDEPEQHTAWKQKIAPLLVESKYPWRRQHAGLAIDETTDFISDRGDEIWNVLEAKGIQNVILAGVHTNMCVLGRPFGLRRMVESGKRAILLRDLTDTMYDPNSKPYVSHFTGTDLIVSHIERHVCATTTSTEFLGGEEFRFSKDKRPHLAILIAEDEYKTEKTLPEFAVSGLGKQYRVTLIYGAETEHNRIPGLDLLQDADALLVSVRRKVLPVHKMQIIKDFVAAGKPVIGIRTASHAFSLRNQALPEGFVDWTEFDAQVFGGNYTNHYGNDLKSDVRITNVKHPILENLPESEFQQGGSLYKTAPLKPGTTVLLEGTVVGQTPEPVAWTFIRKDGGRSFYTSLGHIRDFSNPTFVKLLQNGIAWTLED